jgi:hypothetical protein
MSIELKIKSKSLAEESIIIRKEERKLQKQKEWQKRTGKDYIDSPEARTHSSIKQHRKWNVRNEARATYIARAYLEGKPYRSVEPTIRDKNFFDTYIFERVLSMIGRYGPDRLYKPTSTIDRKWREGAGWKKVEEDLRKWLTSQEF